MRTNDGRPFLLTSSYFFSIFHGTSVQPSRFKLTSCTSFLIQINLHFRNYTLSNKIQIYATNLKRIRLILIQDGDIAWIVSLAVELEPVVTTISWSSGYKTVAVHLVVQSLDSLTVRHQVTRILHTTIEARCPLQGHVIVAHSYSGQKFRLLWCTFGLQSYGSFVIARSIYNLKIRVRIIQSCWKEQNISIFF